VNAGALGKVSISFVLILVKNLVISYERGEEDRIGTTTNGTYL
jgi:hypothetical protein